MSHEHTWTHKTHHGPDLGEAITFSLTIFFMTGHGGYTQMSFCLEILEIGTPATLKAHNFLCRPLIEMRFEENL
jgi:hypothetical protein